MITLKQALDIAVKDERKDRGLDTDSVLSPRIDEAPKYWIFDFYANEERVPLGVGVTIVYKADGRIRYVGSGQVPYFYDNAVPVQPPA